jgi:hypothetical protein
MVEEDGLDAADTAHPPRQAVENSTAGSLPGAPGGSAASVSAARAAPHAPQPLPSLAADSSEEPEILGGYLARAVIAPGVYYFGVVDILQKWTLDKKLER